MSIPFHKTQIAASLPALALCAPTVATDRPKQGAAIQHSLSATKSMRDMRAAA